MICLLAFSLLLGSAHAQQTEQWRAWNQPIEPFRIIGNIYYVGATGIAAYLITGDDGHVVIDGGFKETAPLIRDSIQKLGFRLEDVKILLNSHAHFDHCGGLAELKELTGARLLASPGDAELLEGGGKGDFLLGDEGLFPAVSVDGRLADGEEVRLGDISLTARLTPGHTRGCTTWTMRAEEDGKTYDVVSVCSVTVLPEMKLTSEPSYPGIAEDFAHSFDVLESLPCDVFLASHGMFFGLEDKIKAMKENSEVNPFIDPERYRSYVERGKKRYLERLADEKQASSGD